MGLTHRLKVWTSVCACLSMHVTCKLSNEDCCFFLLLYISKRWKCIGKTDAFKNPYPIIHHTQVKERHASFTTLALTKDTPVNTNNGERTEHFTEGVYMSGKILHKSIFFRFSQDMDTGGNSGIIH